MTRCEGVELAGSLLIVGVLGILVLVLLAVVGGHAGTQTTRDPILEARLRHIEDVQAKILESIGRWLLPGE